MARKTAEAALVGQVVKDLMTSIESAQVVSEDKLLLAWKDAIGEAGFVNAKPYSLSKGLLTVTVKNPSWSQELTLQKRWVIKKLQVALGKDQIQDIRFKTGQL